MNVSVKNNPSALLALAWFRAGDGKGNTSMVVIPYKDQLELLARYLRQLFMESLGKEHDLNAAVVNQRISVFGIKGSTAQHSYMQHIRYGINMKIAASVNAENDVEHVFKVCEYLSANPSHRISKLVSNESFQSKHSKA